VRVRAADAAEAFSLADDIIEDINDGVVGVRLDTSCGPLIVSSGIAFDDLTAAGWVFSASWSHSRL
jgi:hypothetical protein